jgi:hypothetical protein
LQPPAHPFARLQRCICSCGEIYPVHLQPLQLQAECTCGACMHTRGACESCQCARCHFARELTVRAMTDALACAIRTTGLSCSMHACACRGVNSGLHLCGYQLLAHRLVPQKTTLDTATGKCLAADTYVGGPTFATCKLVSSIGLAPNLRLRQKLSCAEDACDSHASQHCRLCTNSA